MKQASFAALEALKNALFNFRVEPAKRGDIADAIGHVLALFDQAVDELFHLEECIDDLARHTGYQLKEKAREEDETLICPADFSSATGHYDPSGPGTEKDEDGFSDCAGCGMPRSDHKKVR